jgi:hypothetical protein
MIDQNVVMASGAENAINCLAKLAVLRCKCVFCLGFGACHADLNLRLMISILANN